MLETIREYALEHFETMEDTEALRRQHASYFLAFAERAEIRFGASEQIAWLNRLEAEHDNLRAALRWSLRETAGGGRITPHGDRVNIGLRLAGALWGLWYLHAHPGEGRQWLEAALATDSSTPASPRAVALLAAGHLAHNQADHGRAAALLAEALVLFRQLGDRRGCAQSLLMLGFGARDRGDYPEMTAHLDEALPLFRDLAAALLDEALRHFRDLGNLVGSAWALAVLGLVAVDRGDHAQAAASLKEALALFRDVGDHRGSAYALQAMGLAALDSDGRARASSLLTEALSLFRHVGDTRGTVQTLESLAEVACARGQLERAARLFGTADAGRSAIGVPMLPAERARLEPSLVRVRHASGEAFAAAWPEGQAMSLEQAVAYALDDPSSA